MILWFILLLNLLRIQIIYGWLNFKENSLRFCKMLANFFVDKTLTNLKFSQSYATAKDTWLDAEIS